MHRKLILPTACLVVWLGCYAPLYSQSYTQYSITIDSCFTNGGHVLTVTNVSSYEGWAYIIDAQGDTIGPHYYDLENGITDVTFNLPPGLYTVAFEAADWPGTPFDEYYVTIEGPYGSVSSTFNRNFSCKYDQTYVGLFTWLGTPPYTYTLRRKVNGSYVTVDFGTTPPGSITYNSLGWPEFTYVFTPSGHDTFLYRIVDAYNCEHVLEFSDGGSGMGLTPFTSLATTPSQLANTICPDGTFLMEAVLTATPTNGNTTYQWYRDGQPIPGSNSAFLYPDQSGSYYVITTHTSASPVVCYDTSSTYTVSVSSLQFTTTPTAATCGNCPDGSITLSNILGGVGNVSFQLENHGPFVGNTYSGLLPGSYTVTGTDSLGCEFSQIVAVGPVSGSSEATETQSVAVYPNPATSRIRVSVGQAQAQTSVINVRNALGQTVQTTRLAAGEIEAELDVASLSNGIYSVCVTGQSKPISLVINR